MTSFLDYSFMLYGEIWYWTPLWISYDRDGSIGFWGSSYSWRSRHCTLNPFWSFGGGGTSQCGWVVIMSYSQSGGSTQTTSWNCFLVIANSYSCPPVSIDNPVKVRVYLDISSQQLCNNNCIIIIFLFEWFDCKLAE